MARIPIYQTDWTNITGIINTVTIDDEGNRTSTWTVTYALTIDKNRITAVSEVIDFVTNAKVPNVRAIYYEGQGFPLYTTETLSTLQGWVNAIDCADLCTDS
mgnify:CR=1 FL=1